MNLTLDKSIGGNDKQWNYSSWQIFLIDRKLPSSVNNAMKRFSSWIEAHVRVHVNVSCNFTANSSNSQRPRGDLSSHAYLEKILRSTAASLGELCDTEVEQNSQQPCIEINEVSRAKDRWTIFSALGCFVFVTLFVYISPTVVCLFAATEDTYEGFRQITVEGPSPVGFRSLIGNYFFSSDCTLWHMVRKFIMRVVILPLPFLVPAVFIEYLLYKNVLSSQISVKERTHLFRPFKMACFACYCFQAFYFYFIIGKTNCTRSCVDEFARDDKHLNIIWLCYHRELPQRMLTRVHTVRSFLWLSISSPCSWFVTDLIQEAKTCSCSPCTVSIFSFCKFFWSIILFLALCVLCLGFVVFCQLPIFFCLLSVAIPIFSPFAVICPSVSSSLWQLMDVNFLHRYILFPVRSVVILLDILVSFLAAFGVVSVLLYAALGVMVFFQLAIPFVFSEQSLPEDVCCVMAACFLWRSYRSFTQKYQHLAAVLFEKHQQLKDNGHKTGLNMQTFKPDIDNIKRTPEAPCDRDRRAVLFEKNHRRQRKDYGRETSLNMQNFTPDYGRTIDNVKRIPKELFDMACEELMPIRESVCKLFLETTLSELFAFIGFSFATMLTVPPATKALLIFAVGLILKIATIFLDRRSRRHFTSEPFDENVREIVKKFINSAVHCYQRAVFDVSPAEFYEFEKGGLYITIFINWSITATVVYGALFGF